MKVNGVDVKMMSKEDVQGVKSKTEDEVEMQTVKYSEETIYTWECPVCGQYHEEDEAPFEAVAMYCQVCETEFSPVHA